MADQFWQPYWNNVDRRRQDTRYQNALARQDMLDQRGVRADKESFVADQVQSIASLPEEQRPQAWQQGVASYERLFGESVQPQLRQYNPQVFQGLAGRFAPEQVRAADSRQWMQNALAPQQQFSDVGPYAGGMQRPDELTRKPLGRNALVQGMFQRGMLDAPQYLNATAPQDPYEGYSSTPQEVMLNGQTMLAYTAPGRPPLPVGRAPQRTPLVEVNTGDKNPLPAGPGNKKFLETTGTLQANRLDELTKQAQSSMERQYGIQVQRANIEQGLKTGAFAPLVNAVASYADGLGINPESLNLPDPTKGQVFNVATFDNLLKALQAQKGPQTEGDAERALKTFASLKNTEEANMFILDYMDAIATRTQDMAEFVDNAAYGKYASSNRPVSLAEKEFRQWARQTPLVAKSKKTGLPITYYEYKKAAIANGIPEGKVDQEWRKFAGVK